MDEKEFIEEQSSISDFIVEGYNVPYDVLLDLIKDKNVDIMDVKLASITDQFLRYIENMEELDMEVTTAFLNVASELLLIKSRSLLPVEEIINEEEEIDPETKLKLRLQEYKLFKEAGEALQSQENVNRFYKQPDKNVGDARIVFNQFNLEKLLDAYAFLLMRTKDKENPEEKKINRDRWTVEEKIHFLNTILKDNKEINFFSLFDETYSKLEVITVFLAVLELLKTQKIEVVQADRYEDIMIKKKEEEDES
ncbi:MAG: segregation/condensation protein A [Clostridia bacterium]|nr:segregation/condensation protein A [Clostridia bacterium]